MRGGLLAVLLVGILAACSTELFRPEGRAVGPIATAEAAAAAAISLTSLVPPVTVLDVTSGKAVDIYTGAYPSWVDSPDGRAAHQRFMDKLDRPAWRVRVTSPRPSSGEDCCVWEELIIDQATGSVLFSVQATGIPQDR